MTDASSILTQNPYDGVNWDEGENLERFRKAIIEGIAKETLRLEQEKAKALEQEKTEAAAAKKSGCYVATAVYGSYDCPQVWTLRRFRDNTLAESWYGRAFNRTYYAVSPTLVRWFGETKWFQRLWRGPWTVWWTGSRAKAWKTPRTMTDPGKFRRASSGRPFFLSRKIFPPDPAGFCRC